MSEQNQQQQTYTVRIPHLKEDKKFRKWWTSRRSHKCAQAFYAMQEMYRSLRG